MCAGIGSLKVFKSDIYLENVKIHIMGVRSELKSEKVKLSVLH